MDGGEKDVWGWVDGCGDGLEVLFLFLLMIDIGYEVYDVFRGLAFKGRPLLLGQNLDGWMAGVVYYGGASAFLSWH